METETLVVIVLGLVGLVGLAVIAYLARTQAGQAAEFARIFESALMELVAKADVALAPYGERLKPANRLLSALEQQVDEPTDWLIEEIAKRTGTPAADIIAILQPPLQRGVDLTDGVPATPPKEPEKTDPGGAIK